MRPSSLVVRKSLPLRLGLVVLVAPVVRVVLVVLPVRPVLLVLLVLGGVLWRWSGGWGGFVGRGWSGFVGLGWSGSVMRGWSVVRGRSGRRRWAVV
ncbi:hypothetical protein ACIO3O_36055 [Streptomyces sp. NPDC087440]|uniref:hypothetical protein n=1 Tax=Streptomyces sp. NPDC087440 TaxID=3365790 RepID=UPI00382D0E26